MASLIDRMILVATALSAANAQTHDILLRTSGTVPEGTAALEGLESSNGVHKPRTQIDSADVDRFSLKGADQPCYSFDGQTKICEGGEDGVMHASDVTPAAYIRGDLVPPEVAPIMAKYHTQYVDGSYTFGYSGGLNSRTESRDSSGTVRGAFNYIDAYGQVQTQRYVADVDGFRTVGTDIPKGTIAVVEDTPDVKAAKETLMQAYEDARERIVRRSISEHRVPRFKG